MKRKRLYGIRKKLIIFTVLAALLPLSVTGIILGSVINRQVTELNLENYTYSNTKMVNNFALIQKSLEELSEGYIASAYIQRSLEQQPLSPQEQAYVNRSLWYSNNQYADTCFFLDNKQNGYFYNRVAAGIRREELLPQEIQKMLAADYARPILCYSRLEIEGKPQEGLFLLRNIRHMDRNVPPGLLIVKAGSKFYQDVFVDIEKHPKASYLMISQEGEVCDQLGDAAIGEQELAMIQQNLPSVGTEVRAVVYEEQAYFISQDPAKGFLFVSVVPMAVIQQPARMFWQIVCWVMAAAITACIVISYLVSRPYSTNIRKLSDCMSNFNAESLNQSVEIRTNTELDQMAVAYNHMLDHIGDLMNQVKAEQEEMRINEYNSLVYQINPHFLYNTLDNIHMLARINGDTRMVTLIQSLSRMLRISLSKGENEVALREELDHVRSYLEIEKIRSSSLFTYEIQAEEGVLLEKVPKIMLQPIVENSIKYGFEELHEGGRIEITAQAQLRGEASLLRIVVKNNGSPIEARTAARLNQMPEQTMEENRRAFPQKSGGYGIANVVSRLQLRYGRDFRMYYEAEQEGTCCTLEIPLSKSPPDRMRTSRR